MARRRSSSKKEVSLFPFLDILGCLIGSLILIITTVVLEQMDTAPMAQAARIEDLKEEAQEERARQKALEKKLADRGRSAGAVDKRLAEARRRADEAARKLAEARQKLAAAERIKVETPSVPPPPDTAALAAKRRQLDEQAAKIRAEIVERQKIPEQAIVILPPGTGAEGPTKGIFIEAANGKVIVHDERKPWEVTPDKLAADPRFKELLAKVAADKNAIITILVRPEGLGSMWQVQKLVTEAGGRFGRVPLPGKGAIDLSETR